MVESMVATTMRKEHMSMYGNAHKSNPPLPHTTLFQVSVAPKWSKYIVEYLTQYMLPKKVSKANRKAIEIEAKDFEIIANQLYKRGKDKQLWLCITEAKYVRVLE